MNDFLLSIYNFTCMVNTEIHSLLEIVGLWCHISWYQIEFLKGCLTPHTSPALLHPNHLHIFHQTHLQPKHQNQQPHQESFNYLLNLASLSSLFSTPLPHGGSHLLRLNLTRGNFLIVCSQILLLNLLHLCTSTLPLRDQTRTTFNHLQNHWPLLLPPLKWKDLFGSR